MVRDINVYIEPNSNGTYVYHPGHFLKGMVEYPLNHVANIHCFSVTVVGKATVNWEKQESSSSRSGDTLTIERYAVNCWGEERFINEETYFLGQKKGPLIALQPGIYRYNFSCQLPHNLPSSWSAGVAEISYYVESNIDLENRYKICFGHTPFTIVRYDDLNLYPELRSPINVEKVKSFSFHSGSLIIRVFGPCTGFALGQNVPFKIQYLNKSSVDVKQTKISLNRLMCFTIEHPKLETKNAKDIIRIVNADGVKGKESKEIVVYLEIPTDLVCSNERYCRLVRISYSIEVEGEVGGFHINPTIHIPITIGNLPARPLP